MTAAPRIRAYGISDTGKLRSTNEDAFYINDLQTCAAVADGVGGAPAGEVASGLFVAAAARIFAETPALSASRARRLVLDTFQRANEDIISYASEHRTAGMSCTAELLVFCAGRYVLGHVGDSRTYLFRERRLRRLTKDHSFVQQQLDLGIITREEARTHRYRNVILRALGTETSIEVDISGGTLQTGDLFLLCSDGLTDMVADDGIAEILAAAGGVEEKARRLVDSAEEAGGRDNITVVLAGAES